MDAWIIDLIARGGYWGIAALMALENIFPPIPSEVIMGVGGIAMARGRMEFWPLLLAGTIGSTAGNYVWFMVGDRLGFERLHPLIERWGRWLTLDWDHLIAATAFFQRHGQWVVFAMRFSPFLRTMISLPAGLAHMSRWKFLLFTFAGAAVWNALLILGGSWFARYLKDMQHVIGPALLIMLVAIVAAYAWRVITWPKRHRSQKD